MWCTMWGLILWISWFPLLVIGTTFAPVLPIHTISSSATKWPASPEGAHSFYGDIRALVNVHGLSSSTAVTVQIWWRRRDLDPAVKTIYVLDSKNQEMSVTKAIVEDACGVITFDAKSGNGAYYVYFLPYRQSGTTSPGFHFSWINSTKVNPGSNNCEDVIQSKIAQVVALENRDDFHGFTSMELMTTRYELNSLPKPSPYLIAVLDDRHHQLRSFGANRLPVRWAQKINDGTALHLSLTAQPGEYLTYQMGLWALSDFEVVSMDFSPLTASSGVTIPRNDITCFNLGGTDYKGKPFTKQYSLQQSHLGSLWVGVQLPSQDGTFSGSVTLSVRTGNAGIYRVTGHVSVTIAGDPVTLSGDTDIERMTRLRWLNSDIGMERTVFEPYHAVHVSRVDSNFQFSVLNKKILVGPDGLLQSARVISNKRRQGKQINVISDTLQGQIGFDFFEGDTEMSKSIVKPTDVILSNTGDSASWTSQWRLYSHGRAVADILLKGTISFDSHVQYAITVSKLFDYPSSVFSNVRLHVPYVDEEKTQYYMIGFGAEGSEYHNVDWTWQMGHGDHMLWRGTTDAGVYIRLKGQGDEWNTPLPGGDSSYIPFIPESWVGSDPTQSYCKTYVGNVTHHSYMECFTGPKQNAQPNSAALQFLFDVIITPAKPLDMRKHWEQRYLQVGYGQLSEYISPQQAHSKGATVVTLHQGVRGIVNNTLVNPYINYPFQPETVSLLNNFTEQANVLNMSVKFYYTVRELSNHAEEIFALMSLQGEVYKNGLGYRSPESTCHDWDCYGGGAFLQQHLVYNYSQCWQQALSNGEFDEAICDFGTSRWFNYYVKGLEWSFSQPPYIDGIYYDGINFDRESMQRVRRVVLAAAKSKKNGRYRQPLLDLHTGHQSNAPPALNYITHYAIVDSVWNGEGFDFSKPPSYWLVEVSARAFGLTGDRLGGTPHRDDFRGMLFGMTERNSATASAFWKLWDSVEIETMEMIGWWETDFDNFVTIPFSLSAQLKGTIYVRYGTKALLVIASWNTKAVDVQVDVNLNSVCGAGTGLEVDQPQIDGLQSSVKNVSLSKPLSIAGDSGVILQLNCH